MDLFDLRVSCGDDLGVPYGLFQPEGRGKGSRRIVPLSRPSIPFFAFH